MVRKIEEIYARIKNKMKVGEKEGEWFETTKGVRQDCPLSPCYLLYNVEDMDEMKKDRTSGGSCDR
jgi:hypothetical protein